MTPPAITCLHVSCSPGVSAVASSVASPSVSAKLHDSPAASRPEVAAAAAAAAAASSAVADDDEVIDKDVDSLEEDEDDDDLSANFK